MKLIFSIPPEVIRNIEYETREICANLTIMHSNNLFIDNSTIVYGENPLKSFQGSETNFRTDPQINTNSSRASCSVKYYTPIIFHTHPRTSYATPSVEDIVKVLKHKIIKTSVMVTAWGVFQIVKIGNILKDIDMNKIKNSIDYINRNTVNPQYLSTRGTEASIGLNKNLEWNQLSNISQKMVMDQIQIINNTLSNTVRIFLNEPYIYLY
jgi:hypothetical protein